MIISFRKPTVKYFVIALTAAIILAILGTIVYFLVKGESSGKGAVVTNGHTCAHIGAAILAKGGSAVDAAIAALFCEGVSMPQSMGLGGGFLMTVYFAENRTAYSLNAREVAPLAASKDMFDGNSSLSTKGGLAVAVPGELRGYWEAYHRYGGKVAWADLVQPTIDLCESGVLVTEYLEKLYASQLESFKKDPVMAETFIDPSTNRTYKKGQVVKRPRLAKSLELMKSFGADALYDGTLTKGFVEDIRNKGGIITVEDMKNYKVKWQEPIVVQMPNNQTLYTAPLPGSGVILSFIMNLLNNYLDNSQPLSVTNWQRIVESFKFGYGKRTELGDITDSNFANVTDLVKKLISPDYASEIRQKIHDGTTSQDPSYYGAKTVQPEDHGTAHICVLAPNGDAVSVTSTINLYFGAGFMSESTGIILNNEMDDFSSPNMNNSFNVPPSEANYIEPGKRPLSSMVPSIVVGDGGVELVIGAAGGTKITTSVAQIAVKHLWFGAPIGAAVQEKRIHHQLFPMEIEFENAFNETRDFVEALHKIGHEYTIAEPGSGFSAVTAISRKGGDVATASDVRRTGDEVIV
ncbi:glutathione hydrolase 1 proenzyme isoform X2 [Tribolium castaneum]|uniref:Gamma-glutamyltranspeptidase 1-like Protein n=1 Tax=Tribolium castaneum TaxID=7070 RepID=D6WVV2_TRICA|nr:PREDICTED: gamma-glutamyltranspeptidase 1 isoform X2 [Tribolium castaneum]EFA08621.1 Gamma-glutamyltranspeptidase 1-like Protein [Tribolium castaneum]|eukprot:XP_970535.2 PREDICTED: gamma-glutamyltranspeptidase 1 isoform X2 [Tribolium castaneum]